MNKAAGFITIHRQILDWEWYKNVNTVCLFIHLLLTANFVEGRFEGKTVKRGQLVTSLTSLAIGTGLSVQEVRTALSHLKSTGEITDESCSKYRVITIVKYDNYQTPTDSSTGGQQGINKPSTGDQQAINKQSTSDQQQYNNGNNGNKGTMEQGNQSISSVDSDRLFDSFWDIYPKKRARKAAEKAWKKLKPDELLYRTIVDSLAKWKQTDEWQKADGQYIPYASTWLNGRRWEDEIPDKKPEQAPIPVKTVAAQQYNQRDYSGTQQDAFRNMLKGTKWEGRV